VTTVEECIRAHAEDLKTIQKVTIVLVVIAFIMGFVIRGLL